MHRYAWLAVQLEVGCAHHPGDFDDRPRGRARQRAGYLGAPGLAGEGRGVRPACGLRGRDRHVDGEAADAQKQAPALSENLSVHSP